MGRANSKPRQNVLPGPLRKNKYAKGFNENFNGYSLPLVVAAALILIAGTAVFANRAGMGLLSSIFQNQSWEAKEAAEIGMTQIISELNKETNRYLMVKRPGDNNGIWTSSSNPFVAATRTNPCTGATEPSYANLDARTGASTAADSSYGTWYIQESGEITRTRGNAIRGFRLTAVTRQEITSTGSPLNVYQNRPSGTGQLVLRVQGLVFRGSTEVASADLEKEFELVPKCCKVSFGAAHGGLDYGINTTTNESICLNSASSLGLGLIAGAGLEGGSMKLIGSTTVEDTNNNDVSPVICIVAPNTTCTDQGNTTTEVARVDMTLPPVRTYSAAFNEAGAKKGSGASLTPKELVECSAATLRTGTGNDRVESPASSCPSNTTEFETSSADRLTNFTYCADSSLSSCGITVINSGVSQTKLPSNCVINAEDTTLHCNISQLSYTNMVFATGSRKIVLYFPNSNPRVNQNVVQPVTGNAQLKQCNTSASQLSSLSQAESCGSASGKDITRLTLFGCPTNSCGPQTVTLRGNNSTVGLFSYFPEGEMQLNGTPTYEGVMWGKTVNAVGTANFVIPAAGLTSVFEMMGMLLNNESTGSTNYGLLAFDFVARATNRYRWL
jgi:hypothetical protein